MKPTRQRLIKLVMPVLVLFFVTIGIALYQTVAQVNAVEAQRSRVAVSAAMEAMVTRISDYAHDNAYWDDAARAVYETPVDRVFLETTWGATTAEQIFADAAIIMEPNGKILVAFRQGRQEDIRLSPKTLPALTRLKKVIGRDNRAASTMVNEGGRIVIVAVAPIRPMSPKLRGLVPTSGPAQLILLHQIGRAHV